MARVCLVSCVSSKLSKETTAEDLYKSPLFDGSSYFAKTRFNRWYILSAKYGLVDPVKHIHPYDTTLKHMPKPKRLRWSQGVIRSLIPRLCAEDVVAFVAGIDYREFLVSPLRKHGITVEVPLEGQSIGKQLQWLKKLKDEKQRLSHLDQFYELLHELEKGVGGRRILGQCTGEMNWPKMGVYFFFEDGEMRTTLAGIHRTVRVGTHTVSRGSKTTLWHRLRTHRGSAELTGNHRGSIFRLHVGAAMLAKPNNYFKMASWGKGQTATAPIRKSEIKLEQEVSKYIGSMSVLWLAVGDEPDATSDRSYLERNIIALLSGPNGPLDVPSPRWLGMNSYRDPIKKSGLWNVNYVDDEYDPRFLEVFRQYVGVTLGKYPQPAKSIAPKDWPLLANRKSNRGQLPLFEPNSHG